MALKGGATQSEADAMEEFVRLMWERYFRTRASEDLLSHSLEGYKAEVVANYRTDGTLDVRRPFDTETMTLRCPPALAESAEAGDQVLVVALGNMSNAFILCRTDMTGISEPSEPEARISAIDFSGLSADHFSVTWEDGATNLFTVTRDGSNRIESVTNTADGFTTEVIWQ